MTDPKARDEGTPVTEASETPTPSSDDGKPAAKKGRSPRRTLRTTAKPAAAEEPTGAKAKAPKETPPSKRPTLSPELARLLAHRRDQDARRPLFTRQASYRYWRIGRDGAWRKPRGLQSKQRRHYGYRSTIVSIGFRSPRLVRGRTRTGFRPVVVRTVDEIGRVDPTHDAVVIARTVGTLQRLVLEEAARKRRVHVLNPLTKET